MNRKNALPIPRGAALHKVVIGFDGCKIILNGPACTLIRQDAATRQAELYEDADNWLVINGHTRHVTCTGRASCTGTRLLLDNLTGAMEWQ